MLSKLKFILSNHDWRYIYGLLLLSLLISLIELIGISAIAPFMAVASDFTLIESKPYFSFPYTLFGFQTARDFVITFGVALLAFYVFRSLINLLYQHLLARFTFGRYYLIVGRLFRNYLGLNYEEFLTKNTSYLTKTITTEAHNFTILLAAALFMTSEVFVVLLIYGTLLFVNFKITLGLTLMLALFGFLMARIITLKIKHQGREKETHQKSFFEILSSSFGNYKIIKLQSDDSAIMRTFSSSLWGYSLANIKNQTFFHIPRLLLEAIGFCMMIAVALYLFIKDSNNITSYLPLLSIYVLALYRLLPSINRILDSYNKIIFNFRSLEIIYQDLNTKIKNLGEKKVDFSEQILLENIHFSYQNKPILQGVNLRIKKGEKVAFIGESGSGKSTLVDVIIGLLSPTKGKILVDGVEINTNTLKNWRTKIGYIPQNVYLFSGSVAENVAFGRDFDEQKIIATLKSANIYDFLISKEGIHTQVGDGGIALSGGQKQRIAIARALYGNPEILVLDEATSALDSQVETKIMEEIYRISEHKTLLIIAHRLSTIANCDSIYKIQNGILTSITHKDIF
ncbi:ABC transporter ATP-binding protein [Helicobacter turcicus]|uniref:ABC transporter ATP-binding protein n=1 Tax=Helicobacter turcicus TaxID=2867412 RepID=A0ABS7JNV8_9HELI|nr:ABC transporter ATP-binding protein [Helicobacter turcicus]MBX7491086.1 ABC transporter ATP-binding protein [Helicobacter turcicus]MBX7545951.1 ABC transporter ATP-binding protein [Helicobacter turcicus]